MELSARLFGLSYWSLLVPQALTLAMVERTGCRLPPRFEYGAMEQ